MSLFQANVTMFPETQTWQPDGTAQELGWTVPKEDSDGKAAIAVKRRNVNLLRHCRESIKWVLVVLESSLFLSMFLPHTLGGETNLEVKEVNKNMQENKQEY